VDVPDAFTGMYYTERLDCAAGFETLVHQGHFIGAQMTVQEVCTWSAATFLEQAKLAAQSVGLDEQITWSPPGGFGFASGLNEICALSCHVACFGSSECSTTCVPQTPKRPPPSLPASPPSPPLPPLTPLVRYNITLSAATSGPRRSWELICEGEKVASMEEDGSGRERTFTVDASPGMRCDLRMYAPSHTGWQGAQWTGLGQIGLSIEIWK